MHPTPPGTSVLGEPSQESMEKYKKETWEWISQRFLRDLNGFKMLLRHYGIDESSSAKYQLLSLALARAHVPYLMLPSRGRGAPSMTRSILPFISIAADKAHSMGLTKDSVYATWADMLGIKKTTVQREVRRYNAAGGGKEKK